MTTVITDYVWVVANSGHWVPHVKAVFTDRKAAMAYCRELNKSGQLERSYVTRKTKIYTTDTWLEGGSNG